MTASRDRLPMEVWLNIFDQIQDKQQLIQCKLVCKHWAPLVDKALLKTIVMTQRNASQLWDYLYKYPKSNRYIQVIDIQDYTEERLKIMLIFLVEAMTSSLKEIRGDVWTYVFIDMIVEAARQKTAPEPLKLEKIPCTALDNDGFVSLAYLVRKTLRFLRLGLVKETKPEYLTKICGNLHEFESLTDLRLADLIMYIDSIQKLDDMLKGCPHLQTLDLLLYQSPTRMATDNLDTWLTQNVQKVDSMETITFKNTLFGNTAGFSSGFNVDLLRYLSFKYPKVQLVDMSGYIQRDQPIVGSLFENAEIVSLRNWTIDTIDHVGQTIDAWKSQNNSVTIEYSASTRATDFSCQMYVHKVKKTNHTQFILKRIASAVPFQSIEQLISSLGNTLTKDLVIDVEHYQDNIIEDLVAPLNVLISTPLIQHLKVKSITTKCDFSISPLNRLHTLELERVGFSSEDIAGIASWAPHLKHLTLTSCKFTAGNFYNIIKPMDEEVFLSGLALDTLTVKDSRMRTQDMYISLTMANSEPQLFYAAPSRPLVKITYEESRLYFSETMAFFIECKSVKRLSMCQDRVNVILEFDEKGNITASEPEIIYSEAIRLKTEQQALSAKYEQAKKYLTEAQIQAIEKKDM